MIEFIEKMMKLGNAYNFYFSKAIELLLRKGVIHFREMQK